MAATEGRSLPPRTTTPPVEGLSGYTLSAYDARGAQWNGSVLTRGQPIGDTLDLRGRPGVDACALQHGIRLNTPEAMVGGATNGASLNAGCEAILAVLDLGQWDASRAIAFDWVLVGPDGSQRWPLSYSLPALGGQRFGAFTFVFWGASAQEIDRPGKWRARVTIRSGTAAPVVAEVELDVLVGDAAQPQTGQTPAVPQQTPQQALPALPPRQPREVPRPPRDGSEAELRRYIEENDAWIREVRAEQEQTQQVIEEADEALAASRAAEAAASATLELARAIRGTPPPQVNVAPAAVNIQAPDIDLGDIGKGFTDALGNLVGGIGDPVKTLTEAAGKAVDVALPSKPLDRPEGVDEYAGRVFILATGAGMAAHSVAAVGSLVPTVGGYGLSSLAALLGKVSGWDPVIDAVWDSRIRAALGTPAQYKWAKVYRPEVPDARLLQELLVKRRITPAEFTDWMGYHGLGDRWIGKAAEIAFRDLTVRDLLLAADTTRLNPGLVDAVLQKQGFGDEEIQLLRPAILFRSVLPEVRTFRSLAERLYRAGFADEAELRDALELARVDSEFLDPLVQLNARLRAVEDAEAEAQVLEDRLEAGNVTPEAVRTRLGELGMRPQRVEPLIQRATFRRDARERAAAEREARAAEKAELQDELKTAEALFNAGTLAESQLRATLLGLGLTPERAEARVTRLRVAKELKEQAARQRAVEREQRELRRADREAEVRAAREEAAARKGQEAERLQEVKALGADLSPAEIEGLFKRDVIGLAEADAMLAARGLGDRARELRLGLWLAELENAAAAAGA